MCVGCLFTLTDNEPRLCEVRARIERKFNSEPNEAKAVAFGKFNKKTKAKQLLRIKWREVQFCT
jgi:hypothetical protein